MKHFKLSSSILGCTLASIALVSCGTEKDTTTTVISTTESTPTTSMETTTTPVSTTIRTPEKIDDNYRVFYEIFPISFSDSNKDGNGDLQGIINRLDYLNDGSNSSTSLGIEGIWLTPIFKSPTYHKYDAISFYDIDSTFGTLDDFKTLIKEAHKRDIKIIMDLALNHTSIQCEWFTKFAAAQKTEDTTNPYYDFYNHYLLSEAPAGHQISKISGTSIYYECNFDTSFPELNYDNQAVRDEMVNVAKYWLDLGVDGFRFDAAKYIYYNDQPKNVEFWTWYIAELKKIKSDIYTVGEVLGNSDSAIAEYGEALNCFNFTASGAEGTIALAAKGGNANNYTSYFENYQKLIRSKNEDAFAVTLLTNHDMDRAAGALPVSTYKAHMAANLMLLNMGSPFIYYGEEIGMKGTRGTSNTDANRRLAMLWGDGDTVRDPVGSTYVAATQANGTVADHLADSSSLMQYYSRVILLRKLYPEIARGTYTALDFKDTKLGGSKIVYGDVTTYIIHNTTTKSITYDLSTLSNAQITKITDYIGQKDATLDGTTLTVGAQTSVILK